MGGGGETGAAAHTSPAMTRVDIGSATVQRIEESYLAAYDARTFFPDWDDAAAARHAAWLAPHHYDPASGCLKLSIHSWLVTLGGRRILIDTCVGNHKPRPARPRWNRMETPWLQRLAAAGVRPDEIDMVMCTHLHADHVGWNTRLENGRWVPTFANATYVFSRADYEHCARLDAGSAAGPVNHGSFRDSVLPVVEAGLARMVTGTVTLDDGLKIEPAPGHTPGHLALSVRSRGQEALLSADAFFHPAQLACPDWVNSSDSDPAVAVATRRAIVECVLDRDVVLGSCHFPGSGLGRVHSVNGAPRWLPLDAASRPG